MQLLIMYTLLESCNYYNHNRPVKPELKLRICLGYAKYTLLNLVYGPGSCLVYQVSVVKYNAKFIKANFSVVSDVTNYYRE